MAGVQALLGGEDERALRRRRTREIDGPVERARLEAETRKMLEPGLELADRVETA